MRRNQSSVWIVLNAVPTFESMLAPSARQMYSGIIRFGVLSTYAPTLCGLARFSAGLSAALSTAGHEVGVVRISDGLSSANDRVVGELLDGSESSVAACAAQLNECDVAVIQHHDNIYGGVHGDSLLEVIAALRVPSVVIVHSVPKSPAPHQRWVLEQIASTVDRVVVLSEVARERLSGDYAVERRKIVAIPHAGTAPSRPRAKRASRPTILTWGLLGPGKGIERVIDAMESLRDVPGRPRYLVVGQTHPKVLESDGEAYREFLVDLVKSKGLGDSVAFDSRYYDDVSLTELIQSCSAVVLPYTSTDQVTSGVLVDALVRGRPVIATAFPHAVELLSSGAGITVEHDDPAALAVALRRVLTQPRLAGAMAAEARHLAPGMVWSAAAASYVSLAQKVLTDRKVLG